MDEQPPAESTPQPAADDHDEAHTQTLTDLLDALDRAAFHRSLAHRDGSPHLRCRTGSGGRERE